MRGFLDYQSRWALYNKKGPHKRNTIRRRKQCNNGNKYSSDVAMK
jgi:hypothetical protein